jgi:hypothetical protein
MAKPLNAKQLAFVREYMINGNNASKAYVAAGYSDKQPNVYAAKMMMREEIREEIEKRKAELNKKLENEFEITQDAIIDEMAKYAFKSRKGAYKKVNPAIALMALTKLGEYKGLGKDGRGGTNKDDRKVVLERLSAYFRKRNNGSGSSDPTDNS